MSDGSLYKDDALLPLYSCASEVFDLEDVVRILLPNYSPDCLCFSQPINTAHNVAFLVVTSNLKRQDNIKCDDMGSWKNNGTPKRLVRVSTDDDGKLSIKTIKENPEHDTTVYLVTRTYYENHSSNDVRKMIISTQ